MTPAHGMVFFGALWRFWTEPPPPTPPPPPS